MQLATAMANWAGEGGAFFDREYEINLYPDGRLQIKGSNKLNSSAKWVMALFAGPLALGAGVAGALAMPELIALFLAMEGAELAVAAGLALGPAAVQRLLN